MSEGVVFIIPCGFKKCTTKAKARRMYLGTYFKVNLKWALRKSINDESVFILSAKHGLLPLNTVIEPYDLKMGMKSSVTNEVVKKQADQLGIKNKKIVAVGGKEYLAVLKAVFVNIKTPFEGLSLGYSMQAVTRDRASYG